MSERGEHPLLGGNSDIFSEAFLYLFPSFFFTLGVSTATPVLSRLFFFLNFLFSIVCCPQTWYPSLKTHNVSLAPSRNVQRQADNYDLS